MTEQSTRGEASLLKPSGSSPEKKWKFKLYVFGANQNSLHALGNLYFVCRTYLKGNCEVDVVDLHDNPLQAFEENILVTPTLVKISPPPSVTVIGTLDDTRQLLAALDISPDL